MRDALGYFHVPGWVGVELCVGDGLARPLPLQFQDWFEIRLVLSGSATLSIGRSRYLVSADSLIVIRPNTLWGVDIGRGEHLSFLSLCIDPALLRKPLTGSSGSETSGWNSPAVFVDPEVRALVLAVQHVMTEGASSHQADALFHQLIVEMNCRGLADSQRTLRDVDTAHPPSIQRAMVLLLQRFAQEISLSELAAVAELSKFHFLRLFSAHVGVTPHRYHLLLRLARARALLRSGVPIADAAADAGFYDQSHLTRCFHAIVGVPPRRFQCDGPLHELAQAR